jgi:hypothetical protein
VRALTRSRPCPCSLPRSASSRKTDRPSVRNDVVTKGLSTPWRSAAIWAAFRIVGSPSPRSRNARTSRTVSNPANVTCFPSGGLPEVMWTIGADADDGGFHGDPSLPKGASRRAARATGRVRWNDGRGARLSPGLVRPRASRAPARHRNRHPTTAAGARVARAIGPFPRLPSGLRVCRRDLPGV